MTGEQADFNGLVERLGSKDPNESLRAADRFVSLVRDGEKPPSSALAEAGKLLVPGGWEGAPPQRFNAVKVFRAVAEHGQELPPEVLEPLVSIAVSPEKPRSHMQVEREHLLAAETVEMAAKNGNTLSMHALAKVANHVVNLNGTEPPSYINILSNAYGNQPQDTGDVVSHFLRSARLLERDVSVKLLDGVFEGDRIAPEKLSTDGLTGGAPSVTRAKQRPRGRQAT